MTINCRMESSFNEIEYKHFKDRFYYGLYLHVLPNGYHCTLTKFRIASHYVFIQDVLVGQHSTENGVIIYFMGQKMFTFLCVSVHDLQR